MGGGNLATASRRLRLAFLTPNSIGQLPTRLAFSCGCITKSAPTKGENAKVAIYHRIFTAFAIEDEWARTYLVGQARNERSPFEFTDMSVKEPWSTEWKSRCRTRIKGCDGVIALVSTNTAKATGQLWEILTAKEERIPIMGIYVSQDNRPWTLPHELSNVRVADWTWPAIIAFLRTL